jgi:hypothetical protein
MLPVLLLTALAFLGCADGEAEATPQRVEEEYYYSEDYGTDGEEYYYDDYETGIGEGT